jgi:hypothetical protein
LHCEALEDRLVPALGNPLQTFADPNGVANDTFGDSVALSGTDVLVGSYGVNLARGAAYLYNTSGTLLHTFTDPNGTAYDYFGFSVALAGTDLLVGGFGVNGSAGAAYLYNTSGTLLQTFTDPNGTANDFFGSSVALAGSDVLVGARGVNGFRGAAYLYNTSGTLLQTFTDPNGTANDYFGSSVALAGTDVLVGAFGVNGFRGAAYLYNTSGTLLQTFSDPNATTNDYFGAAVALSGTDVLVGAFVVNGLSGAAYLYDTSGMLLQTFTDPNAAGGDYFGFSVALAGTDLLVGAPYAPNGGAAYLYNTLGAPLQTFSDPNATTNDKFGSSVALSGTDVLVGDQYFNGSRGAAYLYGEAAGISPVNGNNQGTPVGTPFGTLPEVQVIDALGNPVSGATVTFTETDGSGGAGGAFTGATTVLTNDQGIADVPPLTANDIAGAFTITAVNGGFTTSFNLTNLPGPAAQLALADAPASVTAGVPFSFQVDVLDCFGNLVTDDHSLVAVTLSGGPGGFTAGTSSAQADGGVATFIDSVIQAASASYVLSFSDGQLTGTRAALTITPGNPAELAVVAGSAQSATVGTAYTTPLQVQVTDAYGNLLALAGIAVTFTAPAMGAGGAFGDSTTVTTITDSNGIATAPVALTANPKAGSFAVTATTGGLLGTAFNLTNTPGQAAAIVALSGTPQQARIGTAYANPLQAQVTDKFGNPVAGALVTFTIQASRAAGVFAGSATVTTDSNGIATAPSLTANNTAGSFTVTAVTAGVSKPATFHLTNTSVGRARVTCTTALPG